MKVTDWNTMKLVLEKNAREFLMDAYGLELKIPVLINSRLKSKNGVFWHRTNRKESLRIEISKTYIEHQEWKTVLSTLKHECIHYALYEMDKPYEDGTPTFEAEIVKHGSHSTGTVAYKGKVVQYACTADGCKTVYQKKKRYPRDGKGYRSGCCKAPIKNVGETIV